MAYINLKICVVRHSCALSNNTIQAIKSISTNYFFQSKRLTAEQALDSPFLVGGRARFHTCLCCCCPPRNQSSMINDSTTHWNNVAKQVNHHLLAVGSVGTLSSSGGTLPSSLHSSMLSQSRDITLRIPLFLSPHLMIPTSLIRYSCINLEPTFQDIHEYSYLNTEIEVNNLFEAKREFLIC
ncbi:unnamed protein product [Schistosoma mattheei]|uniref:Uncharacterized protein n=1 Tax=Schistosoma mattheei TaxID=31246 RepID=A0A183Q164_9TREM|nr:unnamed protein product [Schistosoma mattheei]